VEFKGFNIFLGGSYTHPPISEVIIKEEKREPILNANDSGRFKGVQYSRKNNNENPTTSKERNKNDSIPKQVPHKELLPKDPPKKNLSKKFDPKKDPQKKEPTKRAKGKEVELDINLETTIGKMTVQVPLKDIVKLPR